MTHGSMSSGSVACTPLVHTFTIARNRHSTRMYTTGHRCRRQLRQWAAQSLQQFSMYCSPSASQLGLVLCQLWMAFSL